MLQGGRFRFHQEGDNVGWLQTRIVEGVKDCGRGMSGSSSYQSHQFWMSPSGLLLSVLTGSRFSLQEPLQRQLLRPDTCLSPLTKFVGGLPSARLALAVSSPAAQQIPEITERRHFFLFLLISLLHVACACLYHQSCFWSCFPWTSWKFDFKIKKKSVLVVGRKKKQWKPVASLPPR